jgi:hypothetical protein
MFYLDVAIVVFGCWHVLQWLYTCVARVCSKCFICFGRMLQVFYQDVAYTAMAMLQTYVLNISSLSDAYCNCFI